MKLLGAVLICVAAALARAAAGQPTAPAPFVVPNYIVAQLGFSPEQQSQVHALIAQWQAAYQEAAAKAAVQSRVLMEGLHRETDMAKWQAAMDQIRQAYEPIGALTLQTKARFNKLLTPAQQSLLAELEADSRRAQLIPARTLEALQLSPEQAKQYRSLNKEYQAEAEKNFAANWQLAEEQTAVAGKDADPQRAADLRQRITQAFLADQKLREACTEKFRALLSDEQKSKFNERAAQPVP